MLDTEYRGSGQITGQTWRDEHNGVWVDLEATQSHTEAELYSVDNLNSFIRLDLLESSAKRIFTEFNSKDQSVFTWVYSKTKDDRSQKVTAFSKSDALALIFYAAAKKEI